MPTWQTLLTLSLYCAAILLASLVGGMVPMLVRMTHRRMQLAISFVAGFMLGVGLLLMLPHALHRGLPVEHLMLWLLGGFLLMFFIERFFCYHHHDVPAQTPQPASHSHRHPDHAAHAHPPASCGHHHHHHQHEPHDIVPAHHGHELTWSGAAIGLTLHSLFDGVALAAGVHVEAQHTGGWAGLAIFLVVILHKPFDAMSLTTLMGAGGWAMRWRHLVNALFALATVLGVALFYLGAGWLMARGHEVLAPALAFSAGLFLCIAMSDLLPELQFHSHDRLQLSAALLAGLGLAWAVAALEAHSHAHENHIHPPASASPDHEHEQDHEHELFQEP